MNPDSPYVQPSELEFLEEPHIYRVNGRELPSVTGVMKVHGLGFNPDGIPESILERVSHRGSYVHEATVLHDLGTLDEDAMRRARPEWCGFVLAWAAYCRETAFETRVAELRLYSKRWLVAGSPDKVGFRNGRRFGLELKTGGVEDIAVQAGGYDLLWSETFPHAPIAEWEGVKLNADGTYRVIPLDAKEGRRVFECCRYVDLWKEKHAHRRIRHAA